MKDIIIVCAGGVGRETAWLIERINKQTPTWNILGFVDDSEELWGKEVNSYKVLGSIEKLREYPDAYLVCAVGTSTVRKSIVEKIASILPDAKYATLIDPSATVSDYVTIGEGSVICCGSIVTVNIEIGKHVIINLDCTVGHDTVIHDFATIYPSVNVSGVVEIDHCAEIGTGTQIIQEMKIGKYSIVGAGSVVVKHIPDKCTAVGVPAKPIKFFD